MAKKLDEREVAFYSAAVEAWLGTRMERDKTLVTLSAGAIGVIVTILTTVGAPAPCLPWLYGLAVAAFTVAIGACVWIFQANADYLEVAAQGGEPDGRLLGWLDRIAVTSFLFGVVLFGVSGFVAASAAGGDNVGREANRPETVSGAGAPREELQGGREADSGKRAGSRQVAPDSSPRAVQDSQGLRRH